MKIELAGRTALVTASTAGIGLAIAQGLAAAGARVILNGRSTDSVERARQRLLGDDGVATDRKRVLLFGMSGLGKTYLASLLRAGGDWFHYSVDYRIGTRYMGEHIADNFKREAMKVPLLRELLMTDSVYIASNITFDNLAPLSTYLGKPGDPARGGVAFADGVFGKVGIRSATLKREVSTGERSIPFSVTVAESTLARSALARQILIRSALRILVLIGCIMGIVNVTPDSFSDGGLYLDPEEAVSHGLELLGR